MNYLKLSNNQKIISARMKDVLAAYTEELAKQCDIDVEEIENMEPNDIDKFIIESFYSSSSAMFIAGVEFGLSMGEKE